MKLTQILILLFSLSTFVGSAQQKGYEIVDDSVVFTFDLRDYKKYTNDQDGKRISAEDLDINNVYLTGEFNDWSRQGWKMKRVAETKFQLVKSIKELNDHIDWEFKYLVNQSFWAEPDSNFKNITRSEQSSFWNNVYNLKLHTVIPNPNGNATFTLEGFENASEVILSGSFNKWNEEALRMRKEDGGWQLTLDLPPGQYTYQFIIDGAWQHDTKNPEKIMNEFGGFNSVIEITKPTVFELYDHTQAQKVFVSGTFNNWNPEATPMIKNGDHWEACIDLTGGKHQYKFIVDGNWIVDPDNEIKEFDRHGNLNSVIMVQ